MRTLALAGLLGLLLAAPSSFAQVAAPVKQDSAAQGNAGTQYNLGALYDTGQGVVRDYAEARKWYRKAATPFFCRPGYFSRAPVEGGRSVVMSVEI